MPSVLRGFGASHNGDFGNIDAFHFTMKLANALIASRSASTSSAASSATLQIVRRVDGRESAAMTR
jgi:hypothetical protein